MRVNLENNTTNQIKQVKTGFSWTTFFFGFWPALFRGDWKWFGIQLAIEIVLSCLTYGVGAGIVGIVFAFFYNKLYIDDLLSKGFVPSDEASKKALIASGITVSR